MNKSDGTLSGTALIDEIGTKMYELAKKRDVLSHIRSNVEKTQTRFMVGEITKREFIEAIGYYQRMVNNVN